MRAGQFSAYINLNTQVISLVRTPNEFEFQSNKSYTALAEYGARKDILAKCTEYFEENFMPEEKRVIVI